MNPMSRFAYDVNDSDEIRLEKQSIFLVACSCCIAGVLWSLTYLHFFGPGLVTALPLVFSTVVGSALVVSHLRRDHRFAIYAQLIGIIYVPTMLQWNIGGAFDSGLVIAWGLCGPITALMFFSPAKSAFWLGLYLLNIVITAVADDRFAAQALQVADDTRVLFFLMNLGVSAIVVFVFASYFVATAIKERSKANQLLLNILPASVAQTLKRRSGVIAEHHENVSVLFADIVDFTRYAAQTSPQELVSRLNSIFIRFDDLAAGQGLEKIKTIGDAYMVVGGAPQPAPAHLEAMARLALQMIETVRDLNRAQGTNFAIRIGLHCGPVVAGVIGKSKFAYDLWGDTVNVASRMESSGRENSIHVSEAVHEALQDRFLFEERATVELKGKGVVKSFFLLGER